MHATRNPKRDTRLEHYRTSRSGETVSTRPRHAILPSRGAARRSPRTLIRVRAAVAASVIVALLGLRLSTTLSADEPRALAECAMRLAVEVTPDVPDPSDSAFISSLLGDHPGYHLFLLRVVDDTNVILELQGPGPPDRCQAVVNSISNDGRVASIQAS